MRVIDLDFAGGGCTVAAAEQINRLYFVTLSPRFIRATNDPRFLGLELCEY